MELQNFEGPSGEKIWFILNDGDPWFVSRDVCDALGIANGRDAVAKLEGMAAIANIKIHAAQCGKTMQTFGSVEQWAEKPIPEEHGALPHVKASPKGESLENSAARFEAAYAYNQQRLETCLADLVKAYARVKELEGLLVAQEQDALRWQARVRELEDEADGFALRTPTEEEVIVSKAELQILNQLAGLSHYSGSRGVKARVAALKDELREIRANVPSAWPPISDSETQAIA